MIGKVVEIHNEKHYDESPYSPKSSISSISFHIVKQQRKKHRIQETMREGMLVDSSESQSQETSRSDGSLFDENINADASGSNEEQVTLKVVYKYMICINEEQMQKVRIKSVWKMAHKHLWPGNKIFHETNNLRWWSQPPDIDTRQSFNDFFEELGYRRGSEVWRGKFWNTFNKDIKKSLLSKRNSIVQMIQKKMKDGKLNMFMYFSICIYKVLV